VSLFCAWKTRRATAQAFRISNLPFFERSLADAHHSLKINFLAGDLAGELLFVRSQFRPVPTTDNRKVAPAAGQYPTPTPEPTPQVKDPSERILNWSSLVGVDRSEPSPQTYPIRFFTMRCWWVQ